MKRSQESGDRRQELKVNFRKCGCGAAILPAENCVVNPQGGGIIGAAEQIGVRRSGKEDDEYRVDEYMGIWVYELMRYRFAMLVLKHPQAPLGGATRRSQKYDAEYLSI